ncbi:MAG: hypothetical protein IPK07_31355 [Deltaproteobacteria bacterium]|nr:hypothetical protein [Deltaproteobacteria bacterium]
MTVPTCPKCGGDDVQKFPPHASYMIGAGEPEDWTQPLRCDRCGHEWTISVPPPTEPYST